MSVREGDPYPYYSFDSTQMRVLYEMVMQRHYPHRIPPKEWPRMELIGKAMAKGWAVPCRYYPRPWRRGGYQPSFVWPGISDREMSAIQMIMEGKNA